MKITFNIVPPISNHIEVRGKKHQQSQSGVREQSFLLNSVPCDVMFRAKPDSTMLLAQSNKLLCAYSRKPMLPLYTFRMICSKLTKKTTAQAAINFLREYRDYMPEVETEIFDMFEEYGATGKKDFQDILMEKRPEALDRLRQRQKEVLHSTDDYIMGIGGDIAEELFSIGDVATLLVDEGSFSRTDVLEKVECIPTYMEVSGRNQQKLDEIYKIWYSLPRSLMDYDTFIVKYSKYSHYAIAQRLLEMSVASVEDIKPLANGGINMLKNKVLVRMLYNKDKGAMNLARYNEYNPGIKIKENIPKYIDDVCSEIERGNEYFVKNSTYPEDLRQIIIEETNWNDFMPDAITVKPIGKASQMKVSQKGSNRYRHGHK